MHPQYSDEQYNKTDGTSCGVLATGCIFEASERIRNGDWLLYQSLDAYARFEFLRDKA